MPSACEDFKASLFIYVQDKLYGMLDSRQLFQDQTSYPVTIDEAYQYLQNCQHKQHKSKHFTLEHVVGSWPSSNIRTKSPVMGVERWIISFRIVLILLLMRRKRFMQCVKRVGGQAQFMPTLMGQIWSYMSVSMELPMLTLT